MQQTKPNPRVIRFDKFELNRDTGELRKQGIRLKLPAQAFQVLELLLERPGELVSREDLRRALWPADTFVDFEHSLNATINRVREALADSAEDPKFIETLPRRGYRFVVPVPRLPESSLPAQSTTRRWAWISGAVIALVVIWVLALAVYPRFSVRSISLENIKVTRLTDSGTAVRVSISPDGRYVAYAVRNGEKQGLWLRQLATRTDIQILAPDYGDFFGLTFSPDSNYIYFVQSDKNDFTFRYLYSVPVLGGRVQKLITDVDSPISFSPDGREFVYEHFVPPRNDIELKIATANGTGNRLLTTIHNASFVSLGGSGPTWSPNGRTIAVPVKLQTTPARWVLDTISVTDDKVRELFSSSKEYINFGRPVWLPNGDTLLVPHLDPLSRRTQLWTVSFPRGQAHRLTNELSDYDTFDLDITRDGRTVSAIAETGIYNIWAAPVADLSKAVQITSGELPMIWIAETTDGRLLAVDWNFELWVMNPDGSQRAPFGDIHNADWPMPCGRFVLFVSESETLMRVDADGMNATQLVNHNVSSPACSPDGQFAYYVNNEQPQKIWRIPIEGGMPVEIASILGDAIVDRLSVSPDGKLLAYPYSEHTNTIPGWSLAVIPASGGPAIKTFKVSTGLRNPRWSPDGKGLDYLLTRDEVTNLWEQPVAGGGPKQMTKFTSGHMFDFNWSSDHGQLLLTRGNISSNVILLQNFR